MNKWSAPTRSLIPLTTLNKRLGALPAALLRRLRRGIEKESLRATADGRLALTPHPRALGSALTHPHITTDFSESQLELITGVHETIDACVGQLTEIHQVVYRNLGEEILWATSMPCGLPGDDEIPLAQYGRSNVARAKTVYRRGLSYRYGRRMQTISGIHYNFSLPDEAWPLLQRVQGRAGNPETFRDEAYFGLIRNFRRHTWLLLYLFGASPAVCGSFVEGREHGLQPIGQGSLYLPFATSLRMGPLGYQSDVQRSLAVSYNSLRSYAQSIRAALIEPYPPYEAIGVRVGDEYRQLSPTLLQIENEFYGTIRPKRTIRSGERPLHALAERGVEYVEVRCIDVDPFKPVGIDAAMMRFLDVFLLHCLLADSPPDSVAEIERLGRNQHLAAQRGRDPQARLLRERGEVALTAWAGELLDECVPIAAALDDANRTGVHREALAEARAALGAPSTTPSARVLRRMAADHGNSFRSFALEQSLRHREALLGMHCDAALLARYAAMAERSLADQAGIERAENEPFEAFLQRYLSQQPLGMAATQ